jgi:diacylglycerol kinase
MWDFLVSRGQAFRYAFAGWRYVIRTQRNAWIHLLATLMVVSMGLWLRIHGRDWAFILLAIALVWIAELINTAVEAMVDLISPNQHALARVGKDVGAAAVLTAACSAIGIGLLILGPPLWSKLQKFLEF